MDRLRPTTVDWTISAALGVLAVGEATFSDIAWPVATLLVSAIAIAVLPWRRVHPVTVSAVVVAASAIASVIIRRGTDTLEVSLTAETVAMMIAVYALFRWAPASRLPVAAGGVSALILLPAATYPDGPVLVSIAESLVPLGVVFGLALAMRYRARLGEEVIARARLTERNELARELHDVVAHHVSAIAVQAQAAQAVAAERPEVAAEALAAIEAAASTTLTEMRRMVGILRSDDRRPTVGHQDLAHLAESQGPPRVTVSGDIDLASYSAPVGAALLRIAQESTTNARRHSAGVTFIDIGVTRQADTVEIEVINDGVPRDRRGEGFGTIGMEERTAALGGTITVGPRSRGGWSVTATLPLENA